MRTKVTLILLLLNVVLLAVILYARREWRVEQDIARLGKRVLGGEAVGMNSLEITSVGSQGLIRLVQSAPNTPWELKSPIDWPANDNAIRRIIHELEFLETQSNFPVADLEKNGQSLADYGLNPPRLTLSFTRPSSTSGAPDIATRLQIGDTTEVGNRLYVLSPDGKTVHVVTRGLADSLVVGMEELRTDTLFTIPVFEVRSLGLQNAAPAPRVRLRRDNARWSFEAPIVTRASKTEAEIVVSGLNRLRALAFLSDIPVSDSGLDKPSLRVTLEGNNRRETLLLGRPYAPAPAAGASAEPVPNLYYARMEDRPQVFITSIPSGKDELLDTLRRAQEKLRDTRVLDFDPASVTAVSLAAPGQPEPLVIRRDESSAWRIMRGSGAAALPADAARVDNLIQRLALLTVMPHAKDESPFLRDAPSDAEIENYGFNLPQREITLTFANAGSGPAAPSRITLQLGASSANAGTIQARVLGQSFIYAVPSDALSRFPVVAPFYRERTLQTLPEGARITRLVIKPADASDQTPLLSVELGGKPTWDEALASEPEARRDAIKAALPHLATLRAQEFVGDAYTETTLVDGNPAPWKYTLQADYTLAGGSTGSLALQLAERSGGGTQLAGSKELGLVFSLEQPLLDALWTLLYGPRDPGPPAAAAP